MLNSFYDEELEPVKMAQIRKHLAGCGSCREELERLRKISKLLGQIELEADSAILARLHRRADQRQRQRSLQRFAEACTAVAASILIMCGAWLMRPQPASTPRNVPVWENTLVQIPNDARTELPAEEENLAQWLAQDLAGEGNG